MPIIDLTGQRFGRLTVVSIAENYVSPTGKSRHLRWDCICDCGNKCTVYGDALKAGRTKSCGCLQKENLNIINKHGRIKTNKYEIVGETVYVTVEKSEEKVICDLEDWEYLKEYYWNLNTNGYVTAVTSGRKRAMMHKLIMPDNTYEVVDHINRNKLDNRKGNLRYTTYSVNAQNRSLTPNNKNGCFGVRKSKNRWQAIITSYGKKIFIGSFKTKEEAIAARKEAERIYHKEKFV